jgi:hypothetical protein
MPINCRDAAFQSFKYSLNLPSFWFTRVFVIIKLDILVPVEALMCGFHLICHNILGHINLFILVHEKTYAQIYASFSHNT